MGLVPTARRPVPAARDAIEKYARRRARISLDGTRPSQGRKHRHSGFWESCRRLQPVQPGTRAHAAAGHRRPGEVVDNIVATYQVVQRESPPRLSHLESELQPLGGIARPRWEAYLLDLKHDVILMRRSLSCSGR